MPQVNEILERLAHARKHAGLTQSQAGKLIGLSTSGFCDMETGRCTMTLDRFLQLCELFDVDEVWVLTGTNPMFDPQPIINKLGEAHEDLASILETLSMLKQRVE